MKLRIVILTSVVASSLAFSGARAEHAGALYPWSGDSTGIAGTATYSNGEFVYQDYVFDDGGPNGGVTHAAGTTGVPEPLPANVGRGGHAQYPHDWDRYGDNAADIVDVRVTADSGDVYYRITLNTLMVPDSTVVAIAIDEDHDLATGGGDWPLGAHVTLGGWERVYTLWGTGGVVSDANGSAQDLASLGGAVRVDTEENVIEARVPRAVADPGTATWRMWTAGGLWDPSAGQWLAFAPQVDEHNPAIRYAGGAMAGRVPNIFNVAFRFSEDPTLTSPAFGNAQQAEALAHGDLSSFSADVDFSKAGNGFTDTSTPLKRGKYQRVYRSSLNGEGVVDLTMNPCYETVSVDNNLTKHPTCQEYYLSRYQPYSIYVPQSYDPGVPSPLMEASHGYNAYHTRDDALEEPIQDVAERHGALFVLTLARGQGTAYVRAAELDTLEVLEDVKRAYSVDPDRVGLVGGSHSGAMVWFMTALHPDLYSAGVPFIPGAIKSKNFGTENDVVVNFGYLPLGPEGDRLQNVQFTAMDLFPNLRNVPVRVMTGDQDPGSPPGRYEMTVTDRLGELGYDYIHYGCSAMSHTPPPVSLTTQNLEWLVTQVRVPDPRFVVYKGNTGADAWNEPWGNRHDAAYWLRDIRFADPGRQFLARAESKAIPDVRRDPHPLSGQFVTADSPPSACHFKGLALDRTEDALPVSNEVALDLSNVSSATLFAARARLGLDEPLTLSITADHWSTLTLAGLDPTNVVAEIDGEPYALDVVDGAAVLDVIAGDHEYVLHRSDT